MALSKKPVNGMKDILPAEMEIRELCDKRDQGYIQKLRIYTDRDTMHGEYSKSHKQAGRRK